MAEVLITLALLGVVAAFAIPKVLESASNQHFNAIGKEFIAMFSEAQEKMQAEGKLVSNTTLLSTIFESLNISRDTTSILDSGIDCSVAPTICWRLPNGAVAMAGYDQKYVAGADHAIGVALDPDGKLTSTSPTGPGKPVAIWLYGTGEIRTRASLKPNTTVTSFTGDSQIIGPAGSNPDWFSW